MKLYKPQADVVNTLDSNFDNSFVQHHLYLSGEMGVGKTYMGVGLIKKMIENNHASNFLIVCPTTVKAKWKKLINETIEETNAYFVNKKTDQIGGIQIVSNKQLKIIDDLLAIDPTDYDLVIFDEIQDLTTPTMLNYVDNIQDQSKRAIYMTGTIFDASRQGLQALLQITHPYLCQLAQEETECDLTDLIKDIVLFCAYIWQYVSVSISMEDIKAYIDNAESVQQNILPINYLKLNDEQAAFYQITVSRLRQFKNMSNIKLGTIASELIDYPDQQPTINFTEKTHIQKREQQNFISVPLTPIPLKETIKYKALIDFLEKTNLKEKVMIYVNDHRLIEALTNTLQKDGYKASNILTKSADIEQRINNMFKDNDIVIIDPKFITVGVSISNVENLVWYQTLTKMTDILQAQRRITRLDSKNLSNVKFLAYDETYQKELLQEISESNKNNAAAYGYKDKSNLTQLTGIILNDID